ncbi:3'-5' exonuclease, partial [Enterobacter hormaechei]|uniref:3'-5' exonuclease n=1 Tax=Enterobacter hormaechei TaxID=158836 RepID=UPI00217CD980
LFVGKTLLHGDVLMWLMKTLLTSGCTNQRGAGQLKRTDPLRGLDVALDIFAGKVEGTGRITLSTLHSAKGREFDVAIMFGVNKYDFPSKRDLTSDNALREARRLFYVGVTRPRKELHMVYEKGKHSPWIAELYYRSQQT